MNHASATVIVARRARAGQQKRAQTWLDDITKMAASAPGYVRSEIQPPGSQHPNEWVVVYEFESRELLSAWLSSSERAKLVADSPSIFEADVTEQVLKTRNLQDSVTAVASFRLRSDPDEEPGMLDVASVGSAFASEYQHLLSVVSRFPGYIRCDLFPAESGVQDDTIIVFSFVDRPALDRWLSSTERQGVLDRLAPLLATERQLNVVGGFAGWFGVGQDRPVRTWKQAALVLVALYPTALLLGAVRTVIAPDMPGPLATLVGNAGGVVILSWWLMPVLTSRYAAWLRR